MKKTVLQILLSISLSLVMLDASHASDENALRVCVLKNTASLDLKVRGPFAIYNVNNGDVLRQSKRLRTVKVSPIKNGISTSDGLTQQGGIKIVPRGRSSMIYINRRSFRGEVDIVNDGADRLLVINHVDVEDYLKGVLYHEVSHWWPIEALKAQAITARTYALYQQSMRRGKDFDLTNDIYSQVYGGKVSEKWRTNRAVELTRGRILVFNGKIFPSYYHATCGGHTEDASNLWNIDLPPLKGVKTNFCTRSPHYKWRRKIPMPNVEYKLNQAGYSIKNLRGIAIKDKNSSGRIETLTLIGDVNTDIPAKNFRLAVSPNIIRSTNFSVGAIGGNLIFNGLGWGHGVGMCQWGAYFLSARRYKVDEILRHYYPGSEISERY